jgi:protein SCO1/2
MRAATVIGRARGAGLLLALTASLLLSPTERAAARSMDDREALRASQAAIGRTLGGYAFTTADGKSLTFEQLRGRPVVLSLVYTSCYQVCSGLTLRLRETVKVARDALGSESFSVVTLGFDTANDTQDRMRAYARERGVNLPGWYVASADAATMERLVRDVGFTYFASPKGFDHITQITVVDSGGRVVLQVYGEEFAPPSIVEPLKKLVWGVNLDRSTVEGLVNTVKLFCTIYDPTSGRYRFDYSLIVNIVAGGLALGIAAAGIIAALRNVR